MIDDFEPPPPFILTDGERQSALWRKISAECGKRLAELRAQNDGPMNWDQTATLRGHIRCLRAFIALGDEQPPQDG